LVSGKSKYFGHGSRFFTYDRRDPTAIRTRLRE
jgi:hypothetical protein